MYRTNFIALIGLLFLCIMGNNALARDPIKKVPSLETLYLDEHFPTGILTIPNNLDQRVKLEKELLYDKHTLGDTYPYKTMLREFQWYKVKKRLLLVDMLINDTASTWGVLQNYKNKNGKAPLVRKYLKLEYNIITDTLGNGQYQSVPLYKYSDTAIAEIYGRDGTLVKITPTTNTKTKFTRVSTTFCCGEWFTPNKYVKQLSKDVKFGKVIFIDRTNQNILTVEKVSDKWLIRSMNPATTGVNQPPHKQATPLGMFVVQEKKKQMLYTKDGTNDIEGYAPFASRFTNGGHIHGVPVNLPRTEIIEYSSTLGTTPRSHMCVRNASSHAEFIYDWANLYGTIVFVID